MAYVERDDVLKLLEQEPCEKVAQERYADLCEYFGGAKDILKNRKDFKAWLERVKWHIHKAEELYEKYEYKKELCEDAISREAALEAFADYVASGYADSAEDFGEYSRILCKLPPVNPQPKTGHCKDCKYFEYDSVAKVDGIPLIVAHEICSRWGDGCKTSEDGYCFLFEPKERSEG